MEKERKTYARHFIVRGGVALWNGDAAEAGSRFRQFVITSNEFNSTAGIFQAYALEGTAKGVKDGALLISDQDPKVLFDEDFNGLDSAVKKVKTMVEASEKVGFKVMTMMDHMDFLEKQRQSQ
jgi:hypothetical protein